MNLYSFIDWIMDLSEAFELEYQHEIERFEEDRKMKYITSAERIGMKRGYQEGKLEGKEEGKREGEKAILMRALQYKFGAIPLEYQKRIDRFDAEAMLKLIGALFSANTLQDVFTD